MQSPSKIAGDLRRSSRFLFYGTRPQYGGNDAGFTTRNQFFDENLDRCALPLFGRTSTRTSARFVYRSQIVDATKEKLNKTWLTQLRSSDRIFTRRNGGIGRSYTERDVGT